MPTQKMTNANSFFLFKYYILIQHQIIISESEPNIFQAG